MNGSADVWVWTGVSPRGERGIIFYESELDEKKAIIPIMFIAVSHEEAMLYQEMAEEVARENGAEAELIKMQLTFKDEILQFTN